MYLHGAGLTHFNDYFRNALRDEYILAFEQLNPVAQRLLGLPEFAVGTVDTLLPQATGFADFCHATFQSEGVGHYALPTSAGPVGGRWPSARASSW